MREALLEKRVTGEILIAYDELIKAWVTEQLRKTGVSLTEERVEEIVSEALSNFNGGISEADVRQIVTEIIDESTLSGVTQFEEIENVVLETVDDIIHRFPSGVTKNIVFKNVTLHYNEISEEEITQKTKVFKNVLVNLSNKQNEEGHENILIISANDSTYDIYKYDLTSDPTNTRVSIVHGSSTSDIENELLSVGKEVEELGSIISTVGGGLEEVKENITNINQNIQSIQDSSITEERVQEMIDLSVGAAISDSY